MKVIFTALILLFGFQNLEAQSRLAQTNTHQRSTKNNNKKINLNFIFVVFLILMQRNHHYVKGALLKDYLFVG